jgi:hypothetical protein
MELEKFKTAEILLQFFLEVVAIIRAMTAASTSETSVIFCQTALRNISEYSRLHTRRRENQKSHFNFSYPAA